MTRASILKRVSELGILLAFTTGPSSLTYAQQGSTDDGLSILDEVVVTARKREESLQDSPVAISAFSAESLRESGISTMRDLSASVPGLTFTELGSKASSIFIRGIGQKESNAALDPSVGVYINGIYIARTDSQLLDTVDTESLQVLRGPQGTLFGKNTTGGALLVTTKSPNTDAFSGSAGTKLGNYNRRDAKLSLNIPLTEDTLSMRVGVNSVKRDGYLENVVNGRDFGDEDRIAGTARILWEPNDVFSADIFTYASKQNENGAAFTCIYAYQGGRLMGQLAYPGEGSSVTRLRDSCLESERLSGDNKVALNESEFKIKNELVGFTLAWDLDDIEIKSITGVSRQSGISVEDDQDGTRVNALQNGTRTIDHYLSAAQLPIDDEERFQWSEEVNIVGSAFDESLSYTVGLFYSEESMDNTPFTQAVGPGTFAIVNEFSGTDLTGLGIGAHKYLGSQSNLDTSTGAIYGQGTYDFTDWFQLTVGARYTTETRERDLTTYSINYAQLATLTGGTNAADDPTWSSLIDGVIYGSVPAFNDAYSRYAAGDFAIPLVQLPSQQAKKTWHKFTPAVTASFNNLENYMDVEAIDSLMTYVSYSQGFKAGGFEPKGAELLPFDPEVVTTYEVGVKLDSFENRLRINAAIYYMDYEDLQVRAVEGGVKVTDLAPYLANAGEAVIKGYEMEIFALPMENLSLVATFNYTDAKYKDFATPSFIGTQVVNVDRSNEPYAATPKVTGSLTANYTIDTESAGVFVPRVTAFYRDEMYLGEDYISAQFDESYIDAYTVLSARLSWMPDDQWNITAFVDNVADKDYFQGGFATMDGVGAGTAVKGPPRSYGIEAFYEF